MLNQVVLVGRLVEKPEFIENENGKKVCNITLAVPRSFKNSDGVYETDFINIILWNGIALNTIEYCAKGDLIAVKGRLQMHNDKLELIAEKMTFLSNSNNKEKENESEE